MCLKRNGVIKKGDKQMVNLKTERLILRNEKLEDAETLYKFLGCDAEMSKYTGWNPYITLDSAQKKDRTRYSKFRR